MTVPPRTRFGPYEVIAPIGAGGMGEVYRARDSRLGRTVALKLLPADAVADAERRARLEQEARTVALLNHPNICTLFDVGSVDGRVFLVMELLEGHTLAQRLLRGALPEAEAIAIAASMADALERAHRAGVVHRDVKPANIMLTADGPKLLDFGIAKRRQIPTATAGGDTMTLAETSARDVAGTLPYMAPEQFASGDIDHRADLFGLGAVLYEMLTGKRAFDGATPLDVLDAVMRGDPPPLKPPLLDETIRICLRKDRDSRWQSAHDLAAHLRLMSARREDAPPGARTPSPALGFGWPVAAVLAIGLLWSLWPRIASAPSLQSAPLASRLALTFPSNLQPSYAAPLALSPDGASLAIVLSTADGPQLFVRRLDKDELVALPGTTGAEFPFFSPDGEWVGFWSSNKLRKVSTRGGLPIALADSPDVPFRGADWGSETILFAPLALGPLTQVGTNGGDPRPATILDTARGEFSHRWPQVLPGGRAWLYTTLTGAPLSATSAVMLHVPATGETRELVTDALFARYIGDGILLFARDGQIFAVPFDVDRLAIAGDAVSIEEKVVTRAASGATFLSVAANGSAVFVKGEREQARTLTWVDRNGSATAISAPPAGYATPRLSPDGARVAVVQRGNLNRSSLWTYDLRTQVPTRLTTDDSIAGTIAWSPTGTRLLVGLQHDGATNLFLLSADGTSTAERVLTSSRPQFAGSWIGPADIISYAEENADTGSDVFWAELGERKEHPIVVRPRYQGGARLSPDGRWLAYVSDESGAFEVYVTAFPSAASRWKVSPRGGQEVVWSHDGRELFFRQEYRMMAAAFDPSAAPPHGPAQALFEGRYLLELNNPAFANYDVAADGRFIMISSDIGQLNEVQVVLGWAQSLAAQLRSRHAR